MQDPARSDVPTEPTPPAESEVIADDVRQLHRMGYAQELLRRMSGFSNFAVSFSIICILAGGLTSYHLGLSAAGGASIGLGWPLSCLLSFCFALAMAQLASAFPTAGGLYHWASLLGGKGLGWATAWFNLVGLVTVLSAINVGAYLFIASSLGPVFGVDPEKLGPGHQLAAIVVITATQALFNHRGIRLTTRLTDFSGYLIFVVATVLTASMLVYAPRLEASRLVTFTNFSGASGGDVWPSTTSMGWLFLLGLLMPAYTVTGFDASAHTAEETVGAATNVPRAILRAVLLSGIFGYVMVASILLAMPSVEAAASKGPSVFFWVMGEILPRPLQVTLYVGIGITQYLCGLATVTSASRMTYAFARDGGLPFSAALRRVSEVHRTPAHAIWVVAAVSTAFTVYTPVYSTITAVCTIFLYISYGMPIALGLFAYGRTWTTMGPFSLGPWYRLVAAICVLSCALVLVIGVAPPNDKALPITLGALLLTIVVWFGGLRRVFKGPPPATGEPASAPDHR
ncbi:amino acid permease [Polyangium mundeleinium]|uniref:Amino acid permease n=1 Tax=Polyangium mundeleinium TaxID=2995306 RepID=A0ABT5F733_9BACT|nr:amino acid permease [Polyangium mundeleinium]MDC0749918.1 amino acid permease [Polyangium mundeleinium]